jgi:transposase
MIEEPGNAKEATKGEKENILLRIERDAWRREAEDARARIRDLTEEAKAKDFRLEHCELVIANALDLIRRQQRALYGKSSEKGEYLGIEADSLFDEEELTKCDLEQERIAEEAAGKQPETAGKKEKAAPDRKKPRAPYKDQDLCRLSADTPVIDIDHTPETPVPTDGNTGRPMRIVGKRVERKVGYIRKYVIYNHIFPVFGPSEDYEPEPGEARTVVGYPARKRLLKGTMVSEEVVADICVGKYIDHMPLFRMGGTHTRDGVPISRQDMVHWLETVHDKCKPLMKILKRKLLSCDLINMDETPHRVLLEKWGVKCSTTNCEVVQIGTCDEYRVVVYTFNVGKSAKSLAKLLAGYHGALMTDGLSGYEILSRKHLEGTLIRKLACWAHGRRLFIEIVRVNPKSGCVVIILMIRELYTIEAELRKKWKDGGFATKEDFVSERVRRTDPVFARIKAWLDEHGKKAVQGSQLARAIGYFLSRWDALTAYPKEFHATPDDNLSERFTRPFSQGDSAWFFSDTVNGANVSSTIYTLAQNAKLSGINERDYFWALLKKLPGCEESNDYESLLPWKIDLSCLDREKSALRNALPDPERKEEYVIRGGSY